MELSFEISKHGEGEKETRSVFLKATGSCSRCGQHRKEASLYLGTIRQPGNFDKRKGDIKAYFQEALSSKPAERYGLDSIEDGIVRKLESFVNCAKDL